jgi:hypothetical protein
MRHLKTFNESIEIRGNSLKRDEIEDWEYIQDIFFELTKTYWNIIKSNVSAQERYNLNLSQRNIETFSLSRPGKTISGSFEPFKLKDIEYELLTFLNYLGERFICIQINHQFEGRVTQTVKVTAEDLQKGLDYLDGMFRNIYYLYFYYKSDID